MEALFGVVAQDLCEPCVLNSVSCPSRRCLPTACSGYDFKLANTYHVAMVNVDWNDHKDWLKGVRTLITIGLKKYPTAA